jgi:hypothetical protein
MRLSGSIPFLLGGPALCWLAVAAGILSSPAALAQDEKLVVQAIIHNDGSRTISKSDTSLRELQEVSYDRQDILITRRIFSLDSMGRALAGVIYDGSNRVLARVQFGFDDLGRMIEERTTNPQGGVIRRLIYQYDQRGTRLRPVAYNYDPTGRRAPVTTEAKSSLVTPGVNNTTLGTGDRIDRNYRPTTQPPRSSAAGGRPERGR